MAASEAITITDPAWTRQPDEAGPDSVTWTNGHETLVFRQFRIPPDIPAPLSRLDLIWKINRFQSLWRQAAPVDIYTGHIGVAEYLAQIVKFSFNGRTQYQGSLIIPKASFSVMFRVATQSTAADEEREHEVAKIILDGACDVDERGRRWFNDPFSFELVTPVSRNRADDHEWDDMYSSHPLSRIRAILRSLPTACRIDPEILRAEAFTGPLPTPELEEQLAQYAAMFKITATEQAELDALSRRLTTSVEATITEAGVDSSTEALSVEAPVYAKEDPREFSAQFDNRPRSASEEFADVISGLVGEHEEPKLCLIMYSSRRDRTFYQSISFVSAMHASRYNHPKSREDAEILGSAEALQSEFIISRLLRAVNVRCVSVRSDDPDKCRTGVALISATERDWFAKFIALCEMSSMIVCATMFNPNMAKELGITFGLERNRAKFVYRSSDDKFHLGSEQEHAFDVRQLPEVWAYLVAKKLRVSVSVEPSGDSS